jgi:hypothetical protein
MKDVIVSFATKGRENYGGMLLRLIDSCIEHWNGDLLIYSPDHELSEYRGVTIHKGWPDPVGMKSYTHQEMPYQFKTALIQEAIELGYERIIWLDSSMQLKKDLTPLLDNSESGIVTFHNLGHPTWKYLSDEAELTLKEVGYFGFGLKNSEGDLPELEKIEQIWGGAFMLDLTKLYAFRFFDDLKEFSTNGSFKNGGSVRPGFIAHRHDQSVMSVLLSEYPHDMLPYGQILCPPHDRTGEYGTDPYLVCRGL